MNKIVPALADKVAIAYQVPVGEILVTEETKQLSADYTTTNWWKSKQNSVHLKTSTNESSAHLTTEIVDP